MRSFDNDLENGESRLLEKNHLQKANEEEEVDDEELEISNVSLQNDGDDMHNAQEKDLQQLNFKIDDTRCYHNQEQNNSNSTMPNVPSGSVPSVNSLVCRICQTNTLQEPLISPCNCKGTLANVHLTCLERWLNETSRNYCELCMYRFNAIQTLRYTLRQSIMMWIRHPRNRSHVQSDMLISLLLTIVTIGLITVCLLGMQYFVIEGGKLGISQSWTRSAISLFLTIIIIGYLVTLYLVIKDQVIPWYNWWKSTVDVRLLLTPSTTNLTSTSKSSPVLISTATTTRTKTFTETCV